MAKTKTAQMIPRSAAEAIVACLGEAAKDAGLAAERWAVGGGFRRGLEMVGELPLVCREVDRGRWAHALAALAARGEDVIVRKVDGAVCGARLEGIRVEIYAAPLEAFGAMLMHATGSFHLNIHQRRVAAALGMRLSETGLWLPLATSEVIRSERLGVLLGDGSTVLWGESTLKVSGVAAEGGRPKAWARVAGKTEREVYSALGLGFLEPAARCFESELAPPVEVT